MLHLHIYAVDCAKFNSHSTGLCAARHNMKAKLVTINHGTGLLCLIIDSFSQGLTFYST